MKAACALAAGIGIGVVVSIFFAPKSGEETRRWVATKCFDAIDAANEKVWHSRLRVRDVMNKGQQEISEVVAAGREVFAKPNGAENSEAAMWAAT